jgi:hypothetical protein
MSAAAAARKASFTLRTSSRWSGSSPNPESFAALQRNVERQPDQIALNYLIADRDGDTHTLHVSNNHGMASSIFDLHQHTEIWPEIHYLGAVTLEARTLMTVLREARVPLANPALKPQSWTF